MDRNEYYTDLTTANPTAPNQAIHQPEAASIATQPTEKPQAVHQQPSYHYNPSLGIANFNHSSANLHHQELFDLSHTSNEYYSQQLSHLAATQTSTALVDNRSKHSASQLNPSSGSLYMEYAPIRDEAKSKKHTSSVGAVAAPSAMSPPAIENASYTTLNPVVSKPHETSQASAYSSSNYFANLESMQYSTAKPVSQPLHNVHHSTQNQYLVQQYATDKPVGQVYAEQTVAPVQEAFDMRQSTINNDYLGIKCLSRLSPSIPTSKGVTSTQYQNQQAVSPTASFQPNSPNQQSYPAFPTNLTSSSKSQSSSISLNSNHTNYTKAPNQSIPQMHHSYHQLQHRPAQQHMTNVQQRLQHQPQQPQQLPPTQQKQQHPPQQMMHQTQSHQQLQQHPQYQHYGHPTMYHPPHASASADTYASCRQTPHFSLERRNEPMSHHQNGTYNFHYLHQSQPPQQPQTQSIQHSKPPASQNNKPNRTHHSQPPSLHLDQHNQDSSSANRHYNYNTLASAYYNNPATSGVPSLEHHQQLQQPQHPIHSTPHSVYKTTSKDDSPNGPTMPSEQVRYQIAYGSSQPSNLYPTSHNIAPHSHTRMHRRPSVAGASYSTTKYQHQSLPQASIIHNQDLTYLPTEAEIQHASAEHHHLPMVEIYNHQPLYLNNFYNTHPNPQSQPHSLPHHQTHYPTKSSKVIYAPYITNSFPTTDHIQLQQQSSPPESHPRKPTIRDYRYPPKNYHHNPTTSLLEDSSSAYGQPPPLEHLLYPSASNPYSKQPSTYETQMQYGYPKATKLYSSQAPDHNIEPKLDVKSDYVDLEEHIRTSTIHNPKYNEQMATLAKHHPASAAAGLYDRYPMEQSFMPSYRMPSSAEYSKHHHHKAPMLPMGSDCYVASRHQRLPQPSIRDYLSSWNDDEEEESAPEKLQQVMPPALSNVIVSLEPVDALKQVVNSLPDHGDTNGPLPDILVGIEKNKGDSVVEEGAESERLYVLESIPVPLADLSKYRHLNVINRLPDNVVNDLSPEDLAKPLVKPVETSLKFIEEVESSRAKAYKSDFEIDVIYEEDVAQAQKSPMETVVEDAENVKISSASEINTTPEVLESTSVSECDNSTLEQSPEIVVDASPNEAVEPIPSAPSPDFKSQKKLKKSPKSSRRRSSASSTADQPSLERSDSVSYKCINTDADTENSADPTSHTISKLKIKIFRQPSSEGQPPKVAEDQLDNTNDTSSRSPKLFEVSTLQSLCVDTINTETFREYLNQINIQTQLRQNEIKIAESTALEISLDEFITDDQANEALLQGMDRFIADNNKPPPSFLDFYSDSLDIRPLSDVTTLMTQNCGSFDPSSGEDYDEPEVQAVVPLSLIQEDVMQSLVEKHFSDNDATDDDALKEEPVVPVLTEWSAVIQNQLPSTNDLFATVASENNTFLNPADYVRASPSNSSETSELSDIGLSSIDNIMLKEETDSIPEMPDVSGSPKEITPLTVQGTLKLSSEEKHSPLPSVDYNCNESHPTQELKEPDVKQVEPFPSEITKMLHVPEEESIRLQSLFPEMVRTRDPDENISQTMHTSSDDSDSSSSDDDSSISTDGDSIDQTQMPLTPKAANTSPVHIESNILLQHNQESQLTTNTAVELEITTVQPDCVPSVEDEETPSFCAQPISPDRFNDSNESQESITPAPSENQSFSEHIFSSDSCSSIVSNTKTNTLRSLSSCTSEDSSEDEFSTDNEAVDEEADDVVVKKLVAVDQTSSSTQRCTYLSDTDSDSDCSMHDDKQHTDGKITFNEIKVVTQVSQPHVDVIGEQLLHNHSENSEPLDIQLQVSKESASEMSNNIEKLAEQLLNTHPEHVVALDETLQSSSAGLCEKPNTIEKQADSVNTTHSNTCETTEKIILEDISHSIHNESDCSRLPLSPVPTNEVPMLCNVMLDKASEKSSETVLKPDMDTSAEYQDLPTITAEPTASVSILTVQNSPALPEEAIENCEVNASLDSCNISNPTHFAMVDNVVQDITIDAHKEHTPNAPSKIPLEETANDSSKSHSIDDHELNFSEICSESEVISTADKTSTSAESQNCHKKEEHSHLATYTAKTHYVHTELIVSDMSSDLEINTTENQTPSYDQNDSKHRLFLQDQTMEVTASDSETTSVPECNLPKQYGIQSSDNMLKSTHTSSPERIRILSPSCELPTEHEQPTPEVTTCIKNHQSNRDAAQVKHSPNEDSMDRFDTMSVNSEDMLENAFNEAATLEQTSKTNIELNTHEFDTESVNSEDMLESAFNEATSSCIVIEKATKLRLRTESVLSEKEVEGALNESEDIENVFKTELPHQIENNSTTSDRLEKSLDPEYDISKECNNVNTTNIETEPVNSESMLEPGFSETETSHPKFKTIQVDNKKQQEHIVTDSVACKPLFKRGLDEHETNNTAQVVTESVNFKKQLKLVVLSKTEPLRSDQPLVLREIHENIHTLAKGTDCVAKQNTIIKSPNIRILQNFNTSKYNSYDQESDSESTSSISSSSTSSHSSAVSYYQPSPHSSPHTFRQTSPHPSSPPSSLSIRPSPALFDLDSEVTPIESHLTSYHAFDSFELDTYCEPFRNIDNPIPEKRNKSQIDSDHDSTDFDVSNCVQQIWQDVESLMESVRFANRAKRKISTNRSLYTDEPVEKRGRFMIKPIIDISELQVCPINAELLREESVDTIDSEVAYLMGEPEEEGKSQEGQAINTNSSKTTDSLIDDLTLDDSADLDDIPKEHVPDQQTLCDQLNEEDRVIYNVPRLMDLCSSVVQHFCVFFERNEDIGEESIPLQEVLENDVPQEIMLEMEAMFMPEEGEQVEECKNIPIEDEPSKVVDINQEILLEIQSILEPEVKVPAPEIVVEEEIHVFDDHESYIQYEEVVPQNLPKYQLKALRKRLQAKYPLTTEKSCSKQIRRKYWELRKKLLKAKKRKSQGLIKSVKPIIEVKAPEVKLQPVVFKPLPGPRISRTKSCDAPRSYSTSSSSSSSSSSSTATPRTTRSTFRTRPALNHCNSLMEPMSKKSKPNFDEILLGINQFYAKPCANNNNNHTSNNATEVRKPKPTINLSPTSSTFSTDKVKRLIIPRSKIFDANMTIPKRVPPKPQPTPVVRLIRSPLIDRLCKLSAISSIKMGCIKPTPLKLQNNRIAEELPVPKRRLRTKSMFASSR